MPDPRKPKKSPYTADRGIPGAFEGETVTRRRLMTLGVHGLGATATAAFVLPALGFALGPIFEHQTWSWETVGKVDEFPEDTYIPKVITETQGVGDVGNTTVYMRKFNKSLDKYPEDRYNRIVALSSRCMHAGCPVRFVEAAERFICPCHGGVYDFSGQRVGGPPVRPLDHFFTRIIHGDTVQVGPRYSVNSHFVRFSPRLPGQDTDGIGKYLYPAQFDTAARPPK
ncbi:MAG TPA: Rieske (2Fe-2S) protein [Solirubrobacteraceae bacterium]